MLLRNIPSTNELLPVVGLGTWQTFDVRNASAMEPLSAVLNELRQHGGKVIDTSPMYGRSEETIGELTKDLKEKNEFFYATKVWTQGKEEGIKQMKYSMRKMRRTTIELMQVHNLIDWKIHLETLKEWKEKGIIKYIGITHYTDDAHDELEKIISTQQVDFVQFNYSLFSRHAEKRLLPAAVNNGVATLINRPFGEGRLFHKLHGKIIPDWAQNIGISTWSQLLLKYIIAHEAVTCVIPATGNPAHAAENMKAASGEIVEKATLKKMVSFVDNL
jgi:diketogulonate reductase-like aldo/keto reductase